MRCRALKAAASTPTKDPILADKIEPVLLNKGLDTVTPAPLVEPGTMIACMNYEMTSDVGYRRIDGFEETDGWICGEIQDYYRVAVTGTAVGAVTDLYAGRLLTNKANNTSFGVIVSYTGTTASGTLIYAPVNPNLPVPVSGTQVTYDPAATGSYLTFTTIPVKGSATDNAETFVANMRTYSAALRNAIDSTLVTRPIAGVHWFRNMLLVAEDTPYITFNGGSNLSYLKPGALVRSGTSVFRVLEAFTSNSLRKIYVEPVVNAAVGAALEIVGEVQDGSWTYPLIVTVGGTSITLSDVKAASKHATIKALHNPYSGQVRSVQAMLRTVILGFSGATAVIEPDLKPGSLLAIGPNISNYNGGYVLNSYVTSGTFAGGTAAGYVEVAFNPNLSGATGTVGAIDTTFGLYKSGAKQASITSVDWSVIAGTDSLRRAGTRYVWDNYNFFGQQDTKSAYGATGNSRAFWAKAYVPPLTEPPQVWVDSPPTYIPDYFRYVWGNILTDPVMEKDKPKYVAFHGNRLALAHAPGSVVMSVVGEPYNFSGVLGAIEVATGDYIAGLLEAAGDSLIVLNKNAIRRITGTTDSTIQLQTIAANSGAFDYTGALVAGSVVFTGPSGITTVEQAQEYGDFLGTRTSVKVTNVLVPKLVADWTTTQTGGVAMAMSVRSKNQYRLWLNDGQCWVVCFTSDGPRITLSDYGLTDGAATLKVPFAWDSSVTENLKEKLHVVWDADLPNKQVDSDGQRRQVVIDVGTGEQLSASPRRIYLLDNGWGFNGSTFTAYFDLAHLFLSASKMTGGVEKVRLYGMSHGYSTLDVKSSGIETDFEQSYHDLVQDLSLPVDRGRYFLNMHPSTSIVDQANWGLGIKLRINTTSGNTVSGATEPPHICQLLNLFVRTEGAIDA